jgi:hypothetical protein
MASALLTERFGNALQAWSNPTFTSSPATPSAPWANSWCVIPRCNYTFEKTANGCKIYCKCDDEVACGALQNLCRMLAGGTCSLCCTYNGIPCFNCSFTCCNCKCEFTADGCCFTCTTGDKACCAMIQAWCDACACCSNNGCCCYVCLNNQPVCCSNC